MFTKLLQSSLLNYNKSPTYPLLSQNFLISLTGTPVGF